VLRAGDLVWPPPRLPTEAHVTPHAAKAQLFSTEHGPPATQQMSAYSRRSLLLVGLVLLGIGLKAPPAFLTHLTVFVLACFIGYQVVWSVTPALHTPLMSVTNAISGIIIIGGMLQIGGGSAASILGIAAILMATINISGGFLVTQRMLRMFHR
jgi:NAD(P) transhydrogenase subunit alpha